MKTCQEIFNSTRNFRVINRCAWKKVGVGSSREITFHTIFEKSSVTNLVEKLISVKIVLNVRLSCVLG